MFILIYFLFFFSTILLCFVWLEMVLNWIIYRSNNSPILNVFFFLKNIMIKWGKMKLYDHQSPERSKKCLLINVSVCGWIWSNRNQCIHKQCTAYIEINGKCPHYALFLSKNLISNFAFRLVLMWKPQKLHMI